MHYGEFFNKFLITLLFYVFTSEADFFHFWFQKIKANFLNTFKYFLIRVIEISLIKEKVILIDLKLTVEKKEKSTRLYGGNLGFVIAP